MRLPPMAWKRAFLLAAALLIGTNLWWGYTMIDHGVTDTYAEVSNREARADLATLQRLLPAAAPLTRAEVVALLRRTDPGAFIVDDATGVKAGSLRFEFAGDRLVRVVDQHQAR